MDWLQFKNKFHTSWHKELQPFIESSACNKIYNFLKTAEDDIIYPKSINTFRSFKDADLKQIRCAILFREPYHDMEPDGNPLSCFLGHKVHHMLNMWHDAMEKEFYGMDLNILKDHTLDFLIKQGVFMTYVDLTVFRNKPGSHKDVWKAFTVKVIEILTKNNIPILFVGKDVRDRFKRYIPPIYPEFCVKQAIEDAQLVWETEGKFLKLDEYIFEHTKHDNIMWVDMDVPF